MTIKKSLRHPLEGAQDAAAEGRPVRIPVTYPEAEWRPVGEDMPSSDRIGPSGQDIWLYCPRSDKRSASVDKYVNWCGWGSDVEEVKKAGYVLWAPVLKPNRPGE